MRPLQLENLDHPTFIFLFPTDKRISRSVAWAVVCKHCGKKQLAGSSQARRHSHNRCIYCQIPDVTRNRELPQN